MNATISEPFLLSSYRQKKRTQNGITPQRQLESVYLSSASSSKGPDGYATVSVQGDGVHILDLSSLHPVVSHTLGPSTTFSCPAVSRHTIEKGDHICSTYAAIIGPPPTSSKGDSTDDYSVSVQMWKENVSASLDVSQKKTLAAKFHDVMTIYAPKELDSRIIFLSSTGRLTVTDNDLNIQSIRDGIEDSARLIQSFIFSGKSCLFSSARTATSSLSGGVFIVLILQSGKGIQVQILSIEDAVTEVWNCELKINLEQICGISCSSSGHISVITQDGIWQSFQLKHTNGAIQAFPLSNPLHLASLTFVLSTQSPRCRDEVSLLSLSSSHVLLAGITNSPTPEIVLLIWDLQYSIMLASHTLQIPSSLSYSKDAGIKLNLVATSTSQALLVLSSAVDSGAMSETTGTSSPSRSSVLVVPFMVPATSTISNAMGRASDGLKWLASPDLSLQLSPTRDEADHENLFEAMRKALEQNNGKMASEAFFKWEQAEIARLKATDKSGKMANKSKDIDSRPMLAYEFVKRLLNIILQPSKPAEKSPHTAEVLLYLLNKGAVSANMTDGGLLRTLRLRNDWQSITAALEHVRDIPESDLMATLQYVITYHRGRTSDTNAMQVDGTSSDVPQLPTFLSMCVTYKTSPAALRLSIREHLQDADDLICLLLVIEEWISTLGAKDVEMMPSPKTKHDKSTGDLPPLIKILDFLQSILDASLLTIIQYTPSHELLRRIQTLLEPEIAFIDEMEQLRGHLEPFAKAQTRTGSGRGKKSTVDWRTRKKQEQEQIGLAVGLYRLETLVL